VIVELAPPWFVPEQGELFIICSNWKKEIKDEGLY
jgi:hypothetical protein